eukprot:m.20870 g.20870  ORF g.20870 m.20870 type:complete len:101 (+) comp6983_c0_seq1:348-650(+)
MLRMRVRKSLTPQTCKMVIIRSVLIKLLMCLLVGYLSVTAAEDNKGLVDCIGDSGYLHIEKTEERADGKAEHRLSIVNPLFEQGADIPKKMETVQTPHIT